MTHIPEDAVKAFKKEFHENSKKRSYDENIKTSLTAALPHLALSAATARAQAFEEIAHIANQQKEYWDNKQKDCKALEDAYSENGDTYTPLGDDEAWKAGYANGHFSEACWLLGTIRALSPAEPVDQWQDIATAPKDGTWIIAIRPERSFGQWDRVVIVCWSDDYKKWIWPDDVFDVYKDDINETDDEGLCKHDPYQSLDFTHWMPLPAAPTSKGGE